MARADGLSTGTVGRFSGPSGPHGDWPIGARDKGRVSGGTLSLSDIDSSWSAETLELWDERSRPINGLSLAQLPNHGSIVIDRELL
jgi:hypothetical protein